MSEPKSQAGGLFLNPPASPITFRTFLKDRAPDLTRGLFERRSRGKPGVLSAESQTEAVLGRTVGTQCIGHLRSTHDDAAHNSAAS